MFKVQPACPLCNSWRTTIDADHGWHHCDACDAWFNLETGEHTWCLWGKPWEQK